MDKTRQQHSCAVITTSSSSGNVVLVCGGWQRSDCEIYDPVTNTWTNGPSFPSYLSGSAMVTAAPNSAFNAFILGGSMGWSPRWTSNKIYGVKDLTTITLVGTFGNGRWLHVALKNNFC